MHRLGIGHKPSTCAAVANRRRLLAAVEFRARLARNRKGFYVNSGVVFRVSIEYAIHGRTFDTVDCVVATDLKMPVSVVKDRQNRWILAPKFQRDRQDPFVPRRSRSIQSAGGKDFWKLLPRCLPIVVPM